jgi:hypothetical protein
MTDPIQNDSGLPQGPPGHPPLAVGWHSGFGKPMLNLVIISAALATVGHVTVIQRRVERVLPDRRGAF